MSFANWLARGGDGQNLHFALVIEGWPTVYTTGSRLQGTDTHGRVWSARLSFNEQSIRISERFVIQKAVPECDGMTFEITAASIPGADSVAEGGATRDFARSPNVVTWLGAFLDSGDTSATVIDSSQLPDGYYSIGSECIQVTARPTGTTVTIARRRRNTEAQHHYAPDVVLSGTATPIFDHPALRGRRVYLYVFTPEEVPDVSTYGPAEPAGTILWRGRVARQPRLDLERQSWKLTANPVTAWLTDEVGPDLEAPLAIRGAYYHYLNPLVVTVVEHSASTRGTSITATEPALVFGHYESEEEILDAINVALAAAITAAGLTITSIRVVLSPLGGFMVVLQQPASSPKFVDVRLYSAFDGDVNTTTDSWYTDETGLATLHGTAMVASATYYAIPTAKTGVEKIVGARAFLGSSSLVFARALAVALGDPIVDAYPPLRLYVTDPTGIEVGDLVVIEARSSTGDGSTVTHEHIVESINTTDNFIEFAVVGDYGYLLDSASRMRGLKTFVEDGNLADFRDSIVTNSVFANKASFPFLTDSEMASWSTEVAAAASERRITARRRYAFYAPKTLEAIFAQECLLLGGGLRLSADFKLDFFRLLVRAASEEGLLAIDETNTLHPSDGVSFETYDADSEGVLNRVTIYVGYDALQDQHYDVPISYKDGLSISLLKQKLGVEIAPFSREVDRDMDWLDGLTVAEGLLYFLAHDYRIVTIPVDWSVYEEAYVGRQVSVTNPNLPAADGTRGIANEAGFVLGREWEIPGFGRLTIFLHTLDVAGYAPALRVTAGVDGGGDVWTLTVDQHRYSPNVTGTEPDDVDFFRVGDVVEVVEWDTATPGVQTGVVTTIVSATSVVVSFDGAPPWGAAFSGTYDLVFAKDASTYTPTTNQERFCFIADVGRLLFDGTGAKLLAP